MPLDSHLYLVSQGWGGKGTGLRQGAISRPLAIPQKKTLAGLGKDRDEAFPFWDHLFSAASKSIQIKCLSDDEEGNGSSTSSYNDSSLKCTSTGILSNRRPIEGTPAISGTNTPEITAPDSQSHRIGLLATAKRDAAKRALYSNFFRGPVLGPDTIIEEKRFPALVDPIAATISAQEAIKIQTADENMRVDLEVSKSLTMKRKPCEKESGVEDEETKRERKRRRNDKKEKETEKHATEKRQKKEKNRGFKIMDIEANSCTSSPPISQKDQKMEDVGVIVKNGFSGNERDDLKSQSDRKLQKKEEKKRLKRLEKTHAKDAEKIYPNHGSKSLGTKSSGKLEKICSATAPEVTYEHKRKKRKR